MPHGIGGVYAFQMPKKPAPPMVIEWWPIEKVKPYRLNPRLIGESAIQKVADSIRSFGWRQPISVDAKGVVIVGHVRLLAARKLGEETVPVDVVSHLSKSEVRAYRIADNRTNEESGWDLQILGLEMGDLSAAGLDMTLTGFDMEQVEELVPPGKGEAAGPGGGIGSLVERFGVAPFSVLDARAGPWQDRKRAWLALGIESELGRGENLLQFSDTVLEAGQPKKTLGAIPR